MICPTCRNEGAVRKRNGRLPDGRQKWRTTCPECRAAQRRRYAGREAYASDPMLYVQEVIDADLAARLAPVVT